MKKSDAHKEAIYLIKSNIENCKYDIARGVAELAYGIAVISDAEYEKYCIRIEDARAGFHIFD